MHVGSGDNNNNENDNSENDKHDMASTSKNHKGDNNESSIGGEENNNNDGEIEIDHESADNASSTINTPDRVSNRGQLRSFLNHVVKGDDNISDVHVSSTTIETHYELPAKFLWAIPTNIKADVVVNADGSVTVNYPWYAFLFSKNGEIDNKLTQSISSTTGTGASTTLSANAQAHLLNLLFASLKVSSK